MKNIVKVFLLSSLLLSSAIGFAQVQEDGVFFLKEEQYDKALDLLKKEVANQPTSAEKNYFLGEAYFKLGKIDEARAAYNIALLDKKYPFGKVGLGKIELQSGNRVLAVDYFNKAIKTNKKNSQIHAAIASACLQVTNQDTALAREYVKKGLSVSSKNGAIQMVLGDINLLSKNYGVAANDYERVFLYDKSNYEAYRKLGIMYTSGKNYLDAKRNFEESLRLAPNQILGYKKYSELFYMYAKYSEAEKYYSIYFNKVKPTIDEVERYAFILFFNKEYKEASALLDKVVAERGEQANAAIYRVKGYICAETNDTENGLVFMSKLFQIKKSDELLASDYAYYARLLTKSGKDSLAVVNYKSAVAKAENPNDYYEELAKVLVQQKKYQEAADTYTLLMKAGGDKSSGNFNIGKLFYQAGDEQREALYNMTPVPDSKGRVAPMPKEADAVKTKMLSFYSLADSCFQIVNTLSPSYATAYMWRGRIQSIIDPEAKDVKGKEYYEKTLSVMEASADKTKMKRQYIECYNYLGSYYYFAFERSKGGEANEFKQKSISYFNLILGLDPTDAGAKDKVEKLSASK